MPSPDRDPMSDLPWPDPVEPRADISQTIRRECTHGLCAKRGPSAARRVGLSLLLLGLVAALLAWFGAAHQPEGFVRAAAVGALAWIAVQAAVLIAGLGRAPGRRGSTLQRVGIAIGIPLGFLVYLAFASSSRLPSSIFLGGAHADHALTCGLHALLIGGLVSAGLLFIWRGTDPVTPGVSGALAGLTGGLGSAAAMGLACPSTEACHLLAAHGSIVIVLTGVGWLVGRRLLAL